MNHFMFYIQDSEVQRTYSNRYALNSVTTVMAWKPLGFCKLPTTFHFPVSELYSKRSSKNVQSPFLVFLDPLHFPAQPPDTRNLLSKVAPRRPCLPDGKLRVFFQPLCPFSISVVFRSTEPLFPPFPPVTI